MVPFAISTKNGIDPLGGEELILQSDQDKYPTGWSPDGQHIIYDVRPVSHGRATQSESDILTRA